jgi:hypothetical protein
MNEPIGRPTRLRLVFPADYRGNKIEVSANASVHSPAYVPNEERRLMLMKRQQEALPSRVGESNPGQL